MNRRDANVKLLTVNRVIRECLKHNFSKISMFQILSILISRRWCHCPPTIWNPSKQSVLTGLPCRKPIIKWRIMANGEGIALLVMMFFIDAAVSEWKREEGLCFGRTTPEDAEDAEWKEWRRRGKKCRIYLAKQQRRKQQSARTLTLGYLCVINMGTGEDLKQWNIYIIFFFCFINKQKSGNMKEWGTTSNWLVAYTEWPISKVSSPC